MTGTSAIAPNWPADPIDRTDPADPIERRDPADPMERMEAKEVIDAIEAADPALSAENQLSTDAYELADRGERPWILEAGTGEMVVDT